MLASTVCSSLGARDRSATPGLDVELEAGGTHRTKLSLRNACATTRSFRIDKKKLRSLSYPEEGSTVKVAPGGTRVVELTFDAAGRRPGTYKGQLKIRCTDCKKDRRCKVDQKRLDVRVTITEAPDLPLLAKRLGEVEERFRSQATKKAATNPKVASALVARTSKELERAFDAADRDGRLGALEDWGREQLQQVDQRLRAAGSQPPAMARLSGQATESGDFAKRANALTAGGTSGGWLSGFLKQAEQALDILIDLVERNDLKVDLAVASAPQDGALFQLFRLDKDEQVAERSTDNIVEKVYRGLYRYRVEPPEGEPFGAQLDLVRHAPRLCCRLDKGLCCYPLAEWEEYPSALKEACEPSAEQEACDVAASH
jgi:hypothetical protein